MILLYQYPHHCNYNAIYDKDVKEFGGGVFMSCHRFNLLQEIMRRNLARNRNMIELSVIFPLGSCNR